MFFDLRNKIYISFLLGTRVFFFLRFISVLFVDKCHFISLFHAVSSSLVSISPGKVYDLIMTVSLIVSNPDSCSSLHAKHIQFTVHDLRHFLTDNSKQFDKKSSDFLHKINIHDFPKSGCFKKYIKYKAKVIKFQHELSQFFYIIICIL